jgi:hypothetical protein
VLIIVTDMDIVSCGHEAWIANGNAGYKMRAPTATVRLRKLIVSVPFSSEPI